MQSSQNKYYTALDAVNFTTLTLWWFRSVIVIKEAETLSWKLGKREATMKVKNLFASIVQALFKYLFPSDSSSEEPMECDQVDPHLDEVMCRSQAQW